MNLEELQRKWHGLPIWAWAAIVLILGYMLYKKFSGSSSSGGTATTSPLVGRQAQEV